MGSGHILVYAFDVLMDIYRSVGYTDRDAARSILEHNLCGLDIDDRAAQLAYFAVMMKACEYDRRFLRRGVQPHVCAVQESAPLDAAALSALGPERPLAEKLLQTFADGKEYGSLLQPELTEEELTALENRLNALETGAQETLLTLADSAQVAEALRPLLRQARLLTRKYRAVITNPPYMGGSGMNDKLSRFVKEHYPDSKSDLSTCFMERNLAFCSINGFIAMINIPVWMFLSSYEKLRFKINTENTYINMVHPGRGIFGSDFGTTTFVIAKQYIKSYKGSYRRLFEKQGEVASIAEREQAFLSEKGKFTAQQDNFSKIPGAPVAYWVSERFIKCFENDTIDEMFSAIIKGIFTGDNARFLRIWSEISFDTFLKKWMPYSKGGNYRKWYGNLEYVVNWENDGYELYQFSGSGLGAARYFGQTTIVWTKLTSYKTGFRQNDKSVFFDDASPALVQKHDTATEYYLAFLNSIVSSAMLFILSPTLNYQCGEVRKLPVIRKDVERVSAFARNNVAASKSDWDSFETSWDFKKHPMI